MVAGEGVPELTTGIPFVCFIDVDFLQGGTAFCLRSGGEKGLGIPELDFLLFFDELLLVVEIELVTLGAGEAAQLVAGELMPLEIFPSETWNFNVLGRSFDCCRPRGGDFTAGIFSFEILVFSSLLLSLLRLSVDSFLVSFDLDFDLARKECRNEMGFDLAFGGTIFVTSVLTFLGSTFSGGTIIVSSFLHLAVCGGGGTNIVISSGLTSKANESGINFWPSIIGDRVLA